MEHWLHFPLRKDGCLLLFGKVSKKRILEKLARSMK